MASKFQVKLGGEWKDYGGDEDKILKRAYLAGFPNAKYKLRGQQYAIDFKEMTQKNLGSGKGRSIRPPYKWKPPSAPIVPKGPTTCVKVPEGSPGTTIQVPHPQAKGAFISVDVPASAKVGQAMLVPVPEVPSAPPAAPEPAAPAAPPADVPEAKEKSGYSTGAKVAMGAAGVAAVGGLAVAGAVLGEHIAEDGWDATMADLGDAVGAAGETVADAAEDAGAAIADGAEAAVDWTGDAAEAAGDFIMDLF